MSDKDLRAKLTEFFESHRAACIAVGLLLLFGAAAVTHLPGMRAPRERKVRGTGVPPFQGKMERWRAPSLERSEPEALVKAGDAFGEPQAPGAQAEAAADAKAGGKGASKGSRAEDVEPAAGAADGDAGAFGGAAGSGRLAKLRALESASGGSPSAGGPASGSADGSESLAPASGGVWGGSGPLATLKRNLSILAKKAARVAGIAPARSATGVGARGSFDGGGAAGFTAQAQGSGVAAGGAQAGRNLGAAAGSVALAKAPGGSSGAKSGGGGGGGAGDAGGSGGGGSSGGDGGGNEVDSGHGCEARCVQYCKKAGQSGGQCLKDCLKREHCHEEGGGDKEICYDEPDYFEDVPNMLSFVQTAASDAEGIAKACADVEDSNDWMDGVIKSLRGTPGGNRWGYVCKRGDCGNLSKDAIAYYAGITPQNGGRDIRVIDIIQDCGPGGKNAPQWLVFCYNPTHKAGFKCSRSGEDCASGPTTTGGTTGPTTGTTTGGAPGGGTTGATGGTTGADFCDEHPNSPVCRKEPEVREP